MQPTGRRLAALSMTALGVVYGDIGASPLYGFRECFKPEYGLPADSGAVYGVLLLTIWALILVVSVKYLVLMLRLDNRGEGGIMALLVLILSIRRRPVFLGLGLFGAALLYGDGVITQPRAARGNHPAGDHHRRGPEVPEDKRVASERLREGFWRVQASYGFMQRPDVQRVVESAATTA